VGEQDLTAHVDFTALREAGEAAGWRTEGLWPQPQFLTQLVKTIWENPAVFGDWTPAHSRQFRTLIHPEHLGRGFQVFVQSK
jgi:SAM-dependent MidA family methyltransferase